MPTLHEQSVQNMKQLATLVAFNNGELRVNEDKDQPIIPQDNEERIVELEDMTDEQKRIVAAGETIAGSIPQGLSRGQLSAWFDTQFPTK
jgi:hypothetical protein